MAPLERLKILMQVQGNTRAVYTGVWQVCLGLPRLQTTLHHPHILAVWQGLAYMARTEGIRGLFKGNGTNCARIIPNSAVKFFAYEHMARFSTTAEYALQYDCGMYCGSWILSRPACCLVCSAVMKSSKDGQITPMTRLLAGAGAGIIAMSATYPLDMVRGRLTVQEGTGLYKGMWHATSMIVKEVRSSCNFGLVCLPHLPVGRIAPSVTVFCLHEFVEKESCSGATLSVSSF